MAKILSYHLNVFRVMKEKLGIEPDAIKTKDGLNNTIENLKSRVAAGEVKTTDLLNLLTSYEAFKQDNDPIEDLVKGVKDLIKPEDVQDITKLKQFHQGEQLEFELGVQESRTVSFVNTTKDEFFERLIVSDVRGLYRSVATKVVHLPTAQFIAAVEREDYDSGVLTKDQIKALLDAHVVIENVSKVKLK